MAAHGVLRRLWLSAWPVWTLALFASMAAARSLPGGFARTAVTAPILLMAPGSVTLGAVFSRRHRPRGAAFVCYSALLSAVWSAFASLVLYARGVSITAASTYWCLLVFSAVLAVVVQARVVLGWQGRGRRAADRPVSTGPGLSDDESDDARTLAAKGRGYHGILAVVAGVSLLAGGLFAYDDLSHPAPTGYTWMAWTSPHVRGDVPVGSAGTELHFQIVHHQSDRTTFRLSAVWLGSPSRAVAKPLTFSIGPDHTYKGALFVPPLPDGCTYRIVVALTAAMQADPRDTKSRTWSINADVRDPGKSLKTCR